MSARILVVPEGLNLASSRADTVSTVRNGIHCGLIRNVGTSSQRSLLNIGFVDETLSLLRSNPQYARKALWQTKFCQVGYHDAPTIE